MVFFDVTGVLAGDQFEVFGDSGSGNFATHQIVTWDTLTIPEPGSCLLLSLSFLLISIKRRR
jgi:hypothetical protein